MEERQYKWWQGEGEDGESGRHCYRCHQVGPVHLETADDKTVVIRVLKTVKSGWWRWPHEDGRLLLLLLLRLLVLLPPLLLLRSLMFRLRFYLLECFGFYFSPPFPPPLAFSGFPAVVMGGLEMLCRVVKCTDDTMSRRVMVHCLYMEERKDSRGCFQIVWFLQGEVDPPRLFADGSSSRDKEEEGDRRKGEGRGEKERERQRGRRCRFFKMFEDSFKDRVYWSCKRMEDRWDSLTSFVHQIWAHTHTKKHPIN